MISARLSFVLLAFCVLTFSRHVDEQSNTLSVLMPNAIASHVDDYLCTSVKLDPNEPIYITAFNPSATSKDAHHILLYGCAEPGSDQEIWNCGEMASSNDESVNKYEQRPTCSSGSTIIYAWALNAEKTELPKDVAFKIGGSTSIKYLVLQVHYANIDKFKAGETDRSGLILTKSLRPTTKLAGVLLLIAAGQIEAKSEELFQVSCRIRQDIVFHPFAFRTHTHRLGLIVSGYRVRGEGEKQQWTEIGRRSPQLPQMFYPTEKNLTLENGDTVAATCSMHNYQSHRVKVGPTGNDEMCNFYVMYWVKGEQLLDSPICVSEGPPKYYFREERHLNIEQIPDDAFRIPQVSSKDQSMHQHHAHLSIVQ